MRGSAPNPRNKDGYLGWLGLSSRNLEISVQTEM